MSANLLTYIQEKEQCRLLNNALKSAGFSGLKFLIASQMVLLRRFQRIMYIHHHSPSSFIKIFNFPLSSPKISMLPLLSGTDLRQ
jgi:hypothetical protein